MALTSGTRLGTHIITTLIGGGMGGVYQAHDSKLDHDVATKVLPDQFACDQEQLARAGEVPKRKDHALRDSSLRSE